MTAFQNLSVFDTPEAFFANTEEMEKFFYNTALIENTKYENVEQGFLEQGRLSREKAEEFKRISDRAYGKLLGEGQTRITTEIIER